MGLETTSVSIHCQFCYEKYLSRFTLCLFCSSLSPIDAVYILKQIKKPKDVRVVDMYPEDFQRLFETIECSEDDTCKWLYDEFMEDTLT